MSNKPTLTSSAGIPVADNQNSITAGARETIHRWRRVDGLYRK